MGRLLKKKPISAKKKKKQDAQAASSEMTETLAKKSSLFGAGKDNKKQSVTPKPITKKTSDSKIDKGVQFLREVKVEMKKVTWPSRKQTIGSTVVVVILVLIISSFLGIVDVVLTNIVKMVLHP